MTTDIPVPGARSNDASAPPAAEARHFNLICRREVAPDRLETAVSGPFSGTIAAVRRHAERIAESICGRFGNPTICTVVDVDGHHVFTAAASPEEELPMTTEHDNARMIAQALEQTATAGGGMSGVRLQALQRAARIFLENPGSADIPELIEPVLSWESTWAQRTRVVGDAEAAASKLDAECDEHERQLRDLLAVR